MNPSAGQAMPETGGERNEHARRRWGDGATLRFVARFLVLLGALWAALGLVPGMLDALNRAEARVFAWWLPLLGHRPVLDGTAVRIIGLLHSRITFECTGFLSVGIYLAGVLAFPAPWRAKLAGLAAGVPALLLFNEARLLALVQVGVHRPGWFIGLHALFRQANLAAMLACWIVWTRRVVAAGREP